MSSQAGGGGSDRQSSRYRWEQIVSIFCDDLELPHVTDDAQAVEEAREKRKNRWRRERLGTDAARAHAADDKIDRTNWLRLNLPEAVTVVRDEFIVRANAVIAAHRAGEQQPMTEQLRDALVEEAVSSFRAERSLAERWVGELSEGQQ